LAVAPAEVTRAFTHATALRDWLADAAETEPRPGGRLFLWWTDGYHATGQFTAIEPGKKVAFTWHGSGDPEPSRVVVTVRSGKPGTVLALTHGGLGTGKKWAEVQRAMDRGWEMALANLQSVLETGVDLRQARLPRLGIFIDENSAEFAGRLGVPVTQGIRLAGTAPESGAQAAGLQPNDVIVRFGGKKAIDFPSLRTALAGKRAGDVVAVTFYRGAERRTAKMTLSARPMPPPPPATGPALAEAARPLYAGFLADLAGRLAGVSEAEAEHQPAPAEWNLKQLIAHFIACERDLQSWIADMLNDNTVGDSLEFRPNVTVRLDGIARRYGTVAALMGELRAATEETLALLAALPAEFVGRKHLYQRVASWMLNVVPGHLPDEHGTQFDSTLAAARQAQRG
jgi:uncharacterized protein YndB with AHSA1/START domain